MGVSVAFPVKLTSRATLTPYIAANFPLSALDNTNVDGIAKFKAALDGGKPFVASLAGTGGEAVLLPKVAEHLELDEVAHAEFAAEPRPWQRMPRARAKRM